MKCLKFFQFMISLALLKHLFYFVGEETCHYEIPVNQMSGVSLWYTYIGKVYDQNSLFFDELTVWMGFREGCKWLQVVQIQFFFYYFWNLPVRRSGTLFWGKELYCSWEVNLFSPTQMHLNKMTFHGCFSSVSSYAGSHSTFLEC